MPAQKAVRFSAETVVYDPNPRSTGSTTPNSDKSPSPPNKDVNSKSTPSPPPGGDGTNQLEITDVHDVLKWKSTLAFDLSKDPAELTELNEQLPEDIRKEPATSPPLAAVILKSRYLMWALEIRSSMSGSPHPYVTIGDVLGGVYKALRIPVTEEELKACGKEKAVRQACKDRSGEAETQNIKRIDFMEGKVKFRGLGIIKDEPGTLKLFV